MTVARLHHYLPQCYLRGFTTSGEKDGKLCVFDLKRSRSYRTGTRGVGGRKDFNRVDVPGQPPDILETELAKFEASVAPVLRTMRSTREMPTGHDFLVLMNLVGLIAVRNPTFRQQVLDFQKRLFEMVVDVTLSNKGIFEAQLRKMKIAGVEVNESVTYEDVKRIHDEGGFEISVPEGRAIPSEFDGFDAILPFLVNRKWTLCVADNASGLFIGGDNPVVLGRTNDPEGASRMPLGFGLRNTMVTFPLSKELVILGTFEGTAGRIVATREVVADFNKCMILRADEVVFSANEEFEFAGHDDKIYPGRELLSLFRKVANSDDKQ